MFPLHRRVSPVVSIQEFHPRRGWSGIATRLGLVLLSATLCLALYPVGPAKAVDNGALGIRPLTESDFFHISLFPGAAIDATAVVSNHTAIPASLLTYPVDAQTSPQGGFALASQSDTRQGVGAWVHLSTTQIVVPVHSEMKVHFRLTVPAGTPPGEYAGGLIIQSPVAEGKTSSSGGDTAVRLNIIQRQGVRIYVKVAGTAVNSLSYGGLSWQQSKGAVTFALPVRNTGNTIEHPSGSLDLNGVGGSNIHLKFGRIESLLPGATVTLHARQTHAPIAQAGTARATITAEAGTQHAEVTVFYAPWVLLVLGLALAGALFYLTWRVSRFLGRARTALSENINPKIQTASPGVRHTGKARATQRRH